VTEHAGVREFILEILLSAISRFVYYRSEPEHARRIYNNWSGYSPQLRIGRLNVVVRHQWELRFGMKCNEV